MVKTKYTDVEKLKEDLINEIKKIKTMKHMSKFLNSLAIEILKSSINKKYKK